MWKNKLQGNELESSEIWAAGARQEGLKQVRKHRDPLRGCALSILFNPQTL